MASPQLPGWGNKNYGRSGSSSHDIENQVVWVDSDDVYKPIPKPLDQFREEREIYGHSGQSAKVFIKADAINNLRAHLASDITVEQGGILFGNAYQDNTYGVYVEITGAVAAPATRGTSAHLDFTPESWQGIMDLARSEHLGENIVGWYHSHPNMGVFMSGTDMRTQQAFFYHDWCLSIIYDPVSNILGYFLGIEGKTVHPYIFGGQLKEVRPLVITSKGLHHEPNQTGQRENNSDNSGSSHRITNSPNIPQEIQNQSEQLLHPVHAPISEGEIPNNRPKAQLSPLSFIRSNLPWLLVILFLGLLIYDRLNSNPPISQSDLPFTAEIKNMPAKVFKYLEEERDLLAYPIFTAGKERGSGNQYNILLISLKDQNNHEVIDKLDLEVHQVLLNQNQIIQYEQALFLIKDQQEENYTVLPKTITIPAKGGIIFMFSSINNQDSATNSNMNNQGQVSNVVYLPVKIKYKNNKNRIQEILLKDLLK